MQKSNETSVILTKKELTYLLIALTNYEKRVYDGLAKEDEVGDALVDLLVIESIKKRLKKAHEELP